MGESRSRSTIDLSYQRDDKDIQRDERKFLEKSKIQSVKFVPVRCSWVNDTSVVVHHSRGKIRLDLDDFMSKNEVDRFIENYVEGSVAYAVCFRIKTGDEIGTYIYKVTETKELARKAKREIRSVTDIYNQIFYSKADDKNVIEFGLKERLYEENPLTSELFNVTSKISHPYLLLITTPLYGIGLFYGSLVARLIIVLIAIMQFIFILINRQIETKTFKSIQTEDEAIIQRDFNTNNKVVVVELNQESDKTVIHSKELDTTWSFNKNDFGDVCGEEQRILESLDYLESGDKAIVKASRNLTGIEGLESDDHEYVMPEYDDVNNWIM